MADAAAAGPIARGTFVERRGAHIVIALPHTDYRLHLLPVGTLDADPGRSVKGTLRARARRIDVVTTGGAFIEPVYGQPRRLQGRIASVDNTHNTLLVHAGAPVIVTPKSPQKSADFTPGQFVAFDVESGATFEPA